MTRREVLRDIIEYLRGKKLAKLDSQRSEHFDDEVGIDEDGIVIRPPNRKGN
jgi:hypothetical protein